MRELRAQLTRTGLTLHELILENETAITGMSRPTIFEQLEDIMDAMYDSVRRGLAATGKLPGTLGVWRKAGGLLDRAKQLPFTVDRFLAKLNAYAFAAAEENASGGLIVTAPTCGASGVVPAVLYHIQKSRKFPDKRIYHALATAGLIGNIAKSRASISGAEAGCQAEVGVACAMAAAAANYIFGGSLATIEYSAEMGLEHHLGMTCDPVCGLVQIPCIERNAHAAARALDANIYAMYADGIHRISFDKTVEVMKETGHDLPSLYRETSEGGLAKEYAQSDL